MLQHSQITKTNSKKKISWKIGKITTYCQCLRFIEVTCKRRPCQHGRYLGTSIAELWQTTKFGCIRRKRQVGHLRPEKYTWAPTSIWCHTTMEIPLESQPLNGKTYFTWLKHTVYLHLCIHYYNNWIILHYFTLHNVFYTGCVKICCYLPALRYSIWWNEWYVLKIRYSFIYKNVGRYE